MNANIQNETYVFHQEHSEEKSLSKIETYNDEYFLDEDPFYSIDGDVLDEDIRNHHENDDYYDDYCDDYYDDYCDDYYDSEDSFYSTDGDVLDEAHENDEYFLDEDPFYSIDGDVLDEAIRNHHENDEYETIF